MNTDYLSKLNSLNLRYNPDKLVAVETRMLSESKLYDKDVVKYVLAAMKAVDRDYTQKSIDAGENVKKFLNDTLTDVDFDFQGSVMTDTHIKGASDIDLLTFCTKFEGTEIGKVRTAITSGKYENLELQRLRAFSNAFSRYEGDSYCDLQELRTNCELYLSAHYDICDISKPKSIKITNQHLHRDIDVVVAAKHKSLNYVLNGSQKEYLGVRVYNKETQTEEAPDYPFLSIARINQRSAETNGRLKRMIRFLKNVKEDTNPEMQLSTFDINAICYDMRVQEYQADSYIELVCALWCKLYHLLENETYRYLKSVNGDEYIFKSEQKEKVSALLSLKNAVWDIYQDLRL